MEDDKAKFDAISTLCDQYFDSQGFLITYNDKIGDNLFILIHKVKQIMYVKRKNNMREKGEESAPLINNNITTYQH